MLWTFKVQIWFAIWNKMQVGPIILRMAWARTKRKIGFMLRW